MVDTVAAARAPLTGTQSGSLENTAGEIDFDTFVNLLAVQMQYQDPLDPMDTNEMTNQFTQYSQLEQQMATNSHLEKLATEADYSAQALAVSYIDKEVLVPVGSGNDNVPGKVDVTEGESIDFAYEIKSGAVQNPIDIFDSTGVLVQTLAGETKQGVHNITWDGRDNTGNQVPAGIYTIQPRPVDSDDVKSTYTLFTYQKVDAVTTNEDLTQLNLTDGRNVDFEKAIQVRNQDNDDI